MDGVATRGVPAALLLWTDLESDLILAVDTSDVHEVARW